MDAVRREHPARQPGPRSAARPSAHQRRRQRGVGSDKARYMCRWPDASPARQARGAQGAASWRGKLGRSLCRDQGRWQERLPPSRAIRSIAKRCSRQRRCSARWARACSKAARPAWTMTRPALPRSISTRTIAGIENADVILIVGSDVRTRSAAGQHAAAQGRAQARREGVPDRAGSGT
jgi:hypothetical protein